MSYRWPNKDPDEILDYTIDWGKIVTSSETIVDVNWFVDDENKVKTSIIAGGTVNSLTAVGFQVTGNRTTIVLSDGLPNVEYRITCAITISNGNVVERSVKLSVKET